mgnify:CR=1 FL=1
MYRLLLLILISTFANANKNECEELAELGLLMTNVISNSKHFKGVDIKNANNVIFVINPLASDMNISERLVSYDKYLVERVKTDFAGNVTKERYSLTKKEFIKRLKAVKKYIEEHREFPQSPIVVY